MNMRVPPGASSSCRRAESGPDIGHRVEHVGADNEIIGARLKALFRAWLFQIQNPVFHLREGGQLLVGTGEEAGRDVGEGVGVHPAFEERQHLRRQTGGAGPDFQNAQAAPFGQVPGRFLHRAGDAGHPVAGKEAVAIKLIQQFRARTAEEDLHGILFARGEWDRTPRRSRRRAVPSGRCPGCLAMKSRKPSGSRIRRRRQTPPSDW